MRKPSYLFAAALLFVAVSCAAPVRRVPPNPWNPVYTVAVLPMYNATNDVDGPRAVREELFERMKHRHYRVMPLADSDAALRDRMGITLGSQLEMTTAKDIGETLGVDGVVYGYLLNFDSVTTGVYNVKKVRAGFRLVDARTGTVVWAGGFGVKSALVGGDFGAAVTLLKEIKDEREGIEPFRMIKGIEEIPGLADWQVLHVAKTQKAGDAAAIALTEKLLTKALGLHLKPETNAMMNRVMAGFPAGPGAPVQVNK